MENKSPRFVSAVIGRAWRDVTPPTSTDLLPETVLDDPMPSLFVNGTVVARIGLVCLIQLAEGKGEFTLSTNLVGHPLSDEQLHSGRYRWPEGENLTIIPVALNINVNLANENINWFQVMIDGRAVAELPIEVRDPARPFAVCDPVGDVRKYRRG